MSELISTNDNCATIRWKLLTGASALVLTAYASSAGLARAEDTSQPQVWIELGGQLSRLTDGEESFSPLLMDARPSIFVPSPKFERPPHYAFEEDGKISFQPSDTGWIFSASIRIGRSASHQHVNQQTSPPPNVKYYSGANHDRFLNAAKFATTKSQIGEKHAILDFQAGKDVGLGMFGAGGSSTINLGVRFAQFSSKSNITLASDPDAQPTFVSALGFKLLIGGHYHLNSASLEAARSFHGLGPSISWKGSAPVAGNPQNGEIAVDWGVNAALLFGRQRTKVHHQSTSRYHQGKYNYYNPPTTVARNTPPDQVRSRSMAVPNIGGLVGLSYRYADAKISFGYRADMFFHAMDGGIDARKSENRGFFGPFASISVGIGD